MFRRPFAELQHLWKLVGRIDVQNGKRNAPKKALRASQTSTFESLPIDQGMQTLLNA
jgi:hypothetical protein